MIRFEGQAAISMFVVPFAKHIPLSGWKNNNFVDEHAAKKFKELGIEPLELALRSEIGIILSPEKLSTIPQVIEKLMADRMKYKKCIKKLRKQYIFAFGRSSEIGAKHIVDLANR